MHIPVVPKKDSSDKKAGVNSRIPSRPWAPQYKRRRWSPEEDEKLRSIIEQHGAGNWSRISTVHGTRDGKQCRERWLYHIGPNVNKSPLSEEEVALLVRMQAQYGNKWSEISAMMPGRTAASIKNHWNATMARFQKSQKKEVFGNVPVPSGAAKVKTTPETLELHSETDEFSSSECNAPISFPNSDPAVFKGAFPHLSRCAMPRYVRPQGPICLLGEHDQVFIDILQRASGVEFVSLSFNDVEAALNLAEYSTRANAPWRRGTCRKT